MIERYSSLGPLLLYCYHSDIIKQFFEEQLRDEIQFETKPFIPHITILKTRKGKFQLPANVESYLVPSVNNKSNNSGNRSQKNLPKDEKKKENQNTIRNCNSNSNTNTNPYDDFGDQPVDCIQLVSMEEQDADGFYLPYAKLHISSADISNNSNNSNNSKIAKNSSKNSTYVEIIRKKSNLFGREERKRIADQQYREWLEKRLSERVPVSFENVYSFQLAYSMLLRDRYH